jgi:hypothetical protein
MIPRDASTDPVSGPPRLPLFGLSTFAAVNTRSATLPCRQRLCGCPQGVNRAALHRTALEPWVRLPALNRDGSKAVARVQHLNHDVDVAHLARQVFVLLLVFPRIFPPSSAWSRSSVWIAGLAQGSLVGLRIVPFLQDARFLRHVSSCRALVGGPAVQGRGQREWTC